MRIVITLMTLVFLPSIFGFNEIPTDMPSVPMLPDRAAMSVVERAFFEEYSQWIAEKLDRSNMPGSAIAIVKNGETVMLQGFGKRDSRDDRAIDTETTFRVGSLSKGFTGLLVGRLCEMGLMDLDDRVKDYIPEFSLRDSAQTSRVTVGHLLSHSIGIQRHAYTDLLELGFSRARILKAMSSLPTIGAEGKYYGYQNFAFALIEDIIERKTGVTYTDWLQELILDPAGMNSASYTYEAMTNGSNIALPHVQTKNGRYIPLRINKKYYNAVSAGGINASVRDMANWLNVLTGNRPDIAGFDVLDLIAQPYVDINHKKEIGYRWSPKFRHSYGLGWRVLTSDHHQVMYHAGSVNNYRAEIAVDLDNQLGICILFSNLYPNTGNLIPEFLEKYWTFWLNYQLSLAETS